MSATSSDTFNRANSTTTLGTTDGGTSLDPAAWVAQVGTWGINTNQAYVATPSGTHSFATIDLGSGDVDISLDVPSHSGANGAGIVFRYQDANNCFIARMSSGNHWQVLRRLASTETALFSSSSTSTGGTLRIVTSGTQIQFYRNGGLAATLTDSNFTTVTLHGLTSDSATNRVDNWSATVTASPYSAAVNADNPLAYYRLDEPSGDFHDSSGNGHTATKQGTPTYAQTGLISGTSDTCIHTAGNEGGVLTGSIQLNSGSTFSIEAWIQNTEAERTIYSEGKVGQNNPYLRFGLHLGKLQFEHGDHGSTYANCLGATTVNDNAVHHVVAVKNGTNYSVYVDGKFDTSTTATVSISLDEACLFSLIRSAGFDGTAGWVGSIDEVALYDTALSFARISAHYNAGVGSSSTGTSSTSVGAGFGNPPLGGGTYTDITNDLVSVTINRGRSSEFDQFQAGTCDVVLKNLDGKYDPDNSSGPYFGSIVPLLPIQISLNDSTNATYNLFTGFVRPRGGVEVTYPGYGAASFVTFHCIDFLGVLAQQTMAATVDTEGLPVSFSDQRLKWWYIATKFHVNTIAEPIPTLPGSYSGTLLSDLIALGIITSPAQGWNVDAGAVITQGFLGGQNTLQWVQNLALSEGGAVYVDRDGVVQFESKYRIVSDSRSNSNQDEFSDGVAGTTFSDITRDYATSIYNSSTIAADNRDPYSASDSTSITAYTESDYNLSGLLIDGTEELQARANMYVKLYKDPISTPTTVTIKPRRDNTTLDSALHRELRDLVTILFTPVGGTSITPTCWIRSISHTIDFQNGDWTTTFGLESADRYNTAFGTYSNYFTVGTSAVGGSAVLAY